MFAALLNLLSSNFLYFVLHISGNNAFPRPLSAKEEKELLEKKEQGDQQARSKIIEHNLRLVSHIVKKYYSKTNDTDDLISIGTIGLIKAVDSFKPSKNVRLATYAARCIENEILMHFRNLKKTGQDMYMSDPIDTDKNGNTLTLGETIADERDIEADFERKTDTKKLAELIRNMTDEREKEILVLRYGLYNHKPLTQREVAKLLGISRSYVSRIETKALKDLKDEFDK